MSMTDSEAKKHLDELHGKILHSRFAENCTENEIIALIESKIAWMELERYRAIGTVSEFRELKEKATAKKPNDKFEFSPCPRCGSRETLGDGFCYVCGTILD